MKFINRSFAATSQNFLYHRRSGNFCQNNSRTFTCRYFLSTLNDSRAILMTYLLLLERKHFCIHDATLEACQLQVHSPSLVSHIKIYSWYLLHVIVVCNKLFFAQIGKILNLFVSSLFTYLSFFESRLQHLFFLGYIFNYQFWAY